MIFSKTIDLLALYDLHRKRSKEYQFTSIPETLPSLKDAEEFYKSTPADVELKINSTDEDGYKIGTFEYESTIQSEHDCNDKVVGELYLSEATDAPNVIFVHGWRMESNERVKNIFHNRIKQLGWNMYYFTLPYHFEREPTDSLFSGEFMVSANIERTVESSRQAVVDLRALIQWMKLNKKGKVILIGISLGGFITNLTATMESEIDVLASIFYANRMSYSIWNTNPGKFIRADLEHNGVTHEDLIKYWEIIEPNQFKPKMNLDDILLISANKDQYVHMEDTDYLWEAWGQPHRIVYNSGHAGIVLNRNRIAIDTIQFIRERIMRNITI
ncbi:alpha/beta hydrolase [Bacillus sp. AFS054943]|uniref:Alpha/beta hydrolase n=1 Tax=Bacillus cereus TaxID=1396 RepID=A0A2C1LN10_BACCE|nr:MULTISPECIES: alpha/beta hydrolase [Bacillus]PGL78046.1 alpha/beta hydrolase [Bacillus sp. AFS054943]PGT99832.1 alpha/beta hydrolase [Bacillus cereus]TKI39974.1 alpha/beta hydrolase [Bacillus mycoides]